MNTVFIMTCPLCKKEHKVTESQGIVVCSCGNTLADEEYFKIINGELVGK